MYDTRSPFELQPPSARKLLISTVIAVLFAAVVLIVIVLPAEYGIDPIGVGGALGLNALSDERAPPPAATGPVAIDPPAMVPAADPRDPAPLLDPSVHQSRSGDFRSDVVEIHLAPNEEVEYKARLAQEQMLVYSWRVDRGDLYYDFHAEPATGPKGYWVRYEEGDGRSSAHGSLTAPFAGLHGWYFLNYNEFPVTVRLRASGYYEELLEVYRSIPGAETAP